MFKYLKKSLIEQALYYLIGITITFFSIRVLDINNFALFNLAWLGYMSVNNILNQVIHNSMLNQIFNADTFSKFFYTQIFVILFSLIPFISIIYTLNFFSTFEVNFLNIILIIILFFSLTSYDFLRKIYILKSFLNHQIIINLTLLFFLVVNLSNKEYEIISFLIILNILYITIILIKSYIIRKNIIFKKKYFNFLLIKELKTKFASIILNSINDFLLNFILSIILPVKVFADFRILVFLGSPYRILEQFNQIWFPFIIKENKEKFYIALSFLLLSLFNFLIISITYIFDIDELISELFKKDFIGFRIFVIIFIFALTIRYFNSLGRLFLFSKKRDKEVLFSSIIFILLNFLITIPVIYFFSELIILLSINLFIHTILFSYFFFIIFFYEKKN